MDELCHEPHGHVLIGDLSVIENAKLREHVAKGPKYGEPNRVNWKATETMCFNPLISIQSIGLRENKWN